MPCPSNKIVSIIIVACGSEEHLKKTREKIANSNVVQEIKKFWEKIVSKAGGKP